jgi:hypothetical protein
LKIETNFCFIIDRWRSEVSVPMDDLNLNQSTRCSRPKSRLSDIITNNDDETEEEIEQNTGIDQVVTDLSILEYQLINSVSQRKDPLFIRPELKDTIINDLDHYFEDKSSAFNDQYKSDSQELPVVEHKPYINEFNRSISDTKVLIEGLKEAQMYMFQVYACHNVTKQPLSDACSLNGIILAVRTKPGDRMYQKKDSSKSTYLSFVSFLASRDLVRNVQLISPGANSDHLTGNIKSSTYHISWLEPLQPNGLIYFYVIYIGQDSSNGPKEARCVGHDIHSVNVTLLPRTTYRLRIITYTIARLNNEYGDREQISEDQHSSNTTTLFFQLIFTTKDSPSKRFIFNS